MNFNLLPAVTIALAVTACSLLNGCTCNCSKQAVYQPIQTAPEAPGSNATAPFAIQAAGRTNGPLFYQWYLNVNTNDGSSQQSNVEPASNAPLSYQWYKSTNTVEGARH